MTLYSPLDLGDGVGPDVGDEGGLLEGHGGDVLQALDLRPQQDVEPRRALAHAVLVRRLDRVLTRVRVTT